MARIRMPLRIILSITIVTAYIIMAIIGPHFYPNIAEKWDDLDLWKNNPPNAPPAFYGELRGLPKTEWLPGEHVNGRVIFTYDFEYSKVPRDILVLANSTRKIRITIITPLNESYTLYEGDPFPDGIHLGRNLLFAPDWERMKTEKCPNLDKKVMLRPPFSILFTEPNTQDCLSNPKLVRGTYKIILEPFYFPDEEFSPKESARVLVQGESYGILGTDPFGRDVWAGFIGSTRDTVLVTIEGAFIAVGLSFLLGMSGAVRGKVGRLSNLISRLLTIIPLLPFVGAVAIDLGTFNASKQMATARPIVVAFILGLIVAGEASRSVRAIVKEELRKGYVESAIALGGNWSWILKKHMTRVLIPYTLHQFSITIPKILALITLLGFFSIVPGFNWGSIMSQTVVMGRTSLYSYNLNWWQILPVAVSIAVLSISFTLIATWIEDEFMKV